MTRRISNRIVETYNKELQAEGVVFEVSVQQWDSCGLMIGIEDKTHCDGISLTPQLLGMLIGELKEVQDKIGKM